MDGGAYLDTLKVRTSSKPKELVTASCEVSLVVRFVLGVLERSSRSLVPSEVFALAL